MLNTKRLQIRKNQRKQELQQIFIIKRKELMKGANGIFLDIHEQIKSDYFKGISMELISNILTCHHEYTQHQNTFILITNYLIDHNDALPYFLSKIVDSPQYLENYLWCISIIAHILGQQLSKEVPESRYVIRLQMQEAMSSACEVVREMLLNLKSKKQATEQQLNIWLHFMQIIKVQLNYRLFEQFPHQVIQLFTEVLSQHMYIENGYSTQLQATWKCLSTILDHRDDIQHTKQFLSASWRYFWLVLQNLPQQRQECIVLMNKLLTRYSIDFMFAFFHIDIVKELLYLLQQIPLLKPQITTLLNSLVSQSSLDQLCNLLSEGTHKLLAQTLQWSIKSSNSQCLENCLITIYTILSRLQNDNETKLCDRVLSDIQLFNFSNLVQQLSAQRQSKTIDNVLNSIIDDFYTEDTYEL